MNGMFSARPPSWLLPALISGCCAFYLIGPLMITGQVSAASFRYPYLLELFKESFFAGNWYPRWLPQLAGGYGHPLFLFYPPGLWFFALPFSLFFTQPTGAVYAALMAASMLGGIGAYRLCRLFAPPVVALLAIAFFLLSPYFRYELAQGGFSALMAALLCPWAFFYWFRVRAAIGENANCAPSALLLAACMAAVMLAHPAAGFWLYASLAAMTAGALAGHSHRFQLMGVYAASFVLALTLSAPYWLNLFLFSDEMQMPYSAYQPAQYSKLIMLGALSPVFFIAGAAGLLLGRAYIPLFLLFLHVHSASLDVPWPDLPYLQQPLGGMGVMASIEALGIASLLAFAGTPRLLRFVPVLVGLALLAAGVFLPGNKAPFPPLEQYETLASSARQTFSDGTHDDEFLPAHASFDGLPQRLVDGLPPVVLQNDKWDFLPRDLTPTASESDIRVSFDVAPIRNQPAHLTFNQFYFPGWTISVNNEKLALHTQRSARQAKAPMHIHVDENGRMRVQVTKPGHYDVRAVYAGAPFWLIRNVLMLLVGGFCVAALLKLRFTASSLAEIRNRRLPELPLWVKEFFE